MSDTMLRFTNDNLCPILTKDEIRKKAPYVFAEEPTNPNVSNIYSFLNTEHVIDDLAKLGWGVVDCKQQRTRKVDSVKSFHMVAFQNPNIYITKENENGEEIIESYPRLIL